MALEIFRLVGSVFVDTDKAEKSLQQTDKKAGGLGATLVKGAKSIGKFAAGVAGAAAAAGAALVAVAENTREYREEQGKLQAAFKASNFSAETARDTYERMIGVIGETDQTVEAAQQIALLAESEKDAAAWADLAAGVVGRFGDALQPETFYEAANETFSLNEATGAYVQLIEGVGGSVDAFNAGLQACSTEAERQAYMLEYTQSVLGGAAEAYRNANGEIINANIAQDNLNNAMAGIGAAVEPFVTVGKQLLADVLEKLTPILSSLAETTIPFLTSAITTIAEVALPLFSQALEWVTANVLPLLTEGLSTIGGWFDSIKQKLSDSGVTFSTIMEAAQTLFSGAMTVIQTIWTSVGQPVWDLVMSVLGQVYDLFQQHMPAIREFVSKAFTDIKNIWENNLKPALDAIGKFIENVLAPAFKFVFETIIEPVVEAAFSGIVDIWNKSLKPALENILDFITGVFSGDFSGAFSSLVEAIGDIWSGLSGIVKAPLNAVIGILNSFIGKINTLQIPEWVPGIGGKGLDIPTIPTLERGGVLERGQVGFLEGNGAEAVVPLHQNKAWVSAVARDMDTAMGGASNNQVTAVLLDILAAMEKFVSMGIVLDTGALVGGLAKPMDRKLGQIQAAKVRA